MSFAAVIALIATYEFLRGRFVNIKRKKVTRRVALYLGGILLTSLVAGIATSPFAAFHFNRFVDYGLVANIIAVPVTALWIIPWGMVAYLLMPLGLETLALLPWAGASTLC
mgnify:CR=1 FL=1|jgi:competence protein ComEC